MFKTKVKKQKKVTVKGKQKKTEVKKIDNIQSLLLKSGCKEAIQPRSRTYTAVEYFMKHKPIIDRVYHSKDVLKENTSSRNDVIGSQTRENLLKVFKNFKKIVGIEKKEGNPNLHLSFKFSK